jgi:hypothetical protein
MTSSGSLEYLWLFKYKPSFGVLALLLDSFLHISLLEKQHKPVPNLKNCKDNNKLNKQAKRKMPNKYKNN